MKLHTTIDIPPSPLRFSHADGILLLGSCFAENIGQKLTEGKFRTDINPFGVLYNPASIALALRRLASPVPFTADDLFPHDGLFHSFAHHGSFSGASPDAVLQHINRRLEESAAHLADATRLILTFGTARTYRLRSSGQPVANCHKLPAALFTDSLLSPADILNDWYPLLCDLWQQFPDLRILLTVSPIRHWKDGAHGNQISKATLLLAAEELRNAYPDKVDYFPAYELMMDELRDYRFYAADMLHPSPVAIDYIHERFAEACLTDEARQALNEWGDLSKALHHRPLHVGSASHLSFLRQTLDKLDRFSSRYPDIPLETERRSLHEQLTFFDK